MLDLGHRGAGAVLGIAAGLFAAAVALAFDLLRTSQARAQRDQAERHQLLARQAAHEVEEHVAFRLQTLTNAPLRLPGITAEIERSERKHHAHGPLVYRGACAWSIDGVVLESDPPQSCAAPFPVNSNTWRGAPQAPLLKVSNGELMVSLIRRPAARRETDAHGAPPLILGLRLDIDAMLRGELEAWNLQNGDLWVVDDAGTLIYHSTHPEMVGRRFLRGQPGGCTSCHPSLSTVQSLLEAGQGTGTYISPRGRTEVASLARAQFEGATWTMVVNTPADETTRIVRANARRLLLVVGLLVAAFAASGGVAVHASWLRVRAQEEARNMRRDLELRTQVERTEHYLDTVLASSDDLVFTVQADGRIVFANGRLSAFMGIEGATLRDRQLSDLLGAGPAQRLLHDPVPAGGLEIVVAGTGGADQVFLVTRSPVTGTNEVVIVAKDVTERKRAEDALRLSEQRYRAVFQHSLDPIFISSPTGLVQDINEAGAALLGFTSAEGMRGRVRLPDLYADSRQARLQRKTLEREGWFQDQEVELHRPDGRRLVAMLTAWVVHDASGRPAYHGVLRDVTEKRRAEREQRRLQHDLERVAAEWRRTVDALDAAVVVVDGGGYVRRMNRAACAMAACCTPEVTGRDFADYLGRSLAQFAEMEPWISIRPLEEQARSQGGSATRRIVDAVSGKVWDAEAVAMADGRGGTVLLVNDVTRAVEMEDAARRGATLATMGALVAGVAHEVRNPLFGISANVDALEAIVGDQQDLAEPLAALRRGLARLTTLMEDLLLYGRPAPERLKPCELGEVLSLATADARQLAAGSAVELEVVPPPEEYRVAGDRSRLEQVFRNLLENAVQHTPAGGRIVVAAAHFSRHDRCWVRCTVSDAGPGFREADLPRVFDPFFTRRRGGTGLGLAIVQRIVAEHDGRSHAANAPGGGACVTVELPLVEHSC